MQVFTEKKENLLFTKLDWKHSGTCDQSKEVTAMINTAKLQEILVDYKKGFDAWWKNEKYKWEAVHHFQQHWNINAPDFLEMFTQATSKTGNLLASRQNFPRRMILKFAAADAEAVRSMFLDLFDESKDLAARVEKFVSTADRLMEEYNDGTWRNHWQNINSVSTYLWLRFPDKYYIYKYSEYVEAARILNPSLLPKKGGGTVSLITGFQLYDQVCEELAKDSELIQLLQSNLDSTCYPDRALKTLTIDVGFYISRVYAKEKQKTEWFPNDYSPNISVEQWLELLPNREVFSKSSLEIMKRMKHRGGMATCKQLSVRYGEGRGFYNAGSISLAKRVAKFANCPLPPGIQNEKWWPILYLGKLTEDKTEGVFIWKLRPELSEALDRYDLSDIKLYADDADESDIRYWWLTANPKIWSFGDLHVGGVQSYSFYNERGNKRRIFQNFLDAKTGDLIIGYDASPTKQVVALGTVTENDGERLYFEKTEGLVNPISYEELKCCPELENMEFFANPKGSLFKLTKDEYDFILDLIREENPLPQTDGIEPYTKQNFLQEVYLSDADYDTLESLLRNKKNLILEGPPGVGKTYAAKRLAWAVMGAKKDDNIEFIQFHQNYSYEDFVMGYKPIGASFELEYGIFYRFCLKAANKPDEPFFFIIDEINRGNMSKIFGELLMLIEKNYRGTKTTLAYDKRPFTVPENIHIIGMMNTADRSLAFIDYALRRRFSFFAMDPAFDSDGFRAYQKQLNNETFDALIERIKELNRAIYSDTSLGKGFRIGHSYFCNRTPENCTEEWMKEVVEYEIIPMLNEYWFDDADKIRHWENVLRGVFND